MRGESESDARPVAAGVPMALRAAGGLHCQSPRLPRPLKPTGLPRLPCLTVRSIYFSGLRAEKSEKTLIAKTRCIIFFWREVLGGLLCPALPQPTVEVSMPCLVATSAECNEV